MRNRPTALPPARFVLSMGLAILFAFALAISSPGHVVFAQDTVQSGGPPPQGPDHHAVHRNLNLQVLPQSTTGPELMKVMHSFEGELGVKCGFCHASDPESHRLDFASDVKPEKATARVMMHMTADINAKYLTQINDPDHGNQPTPTVTCGTCHRGHSMPEMYMPPPEAEQHHDDHPAPPPPPA